MAPSASSSRTKTDRQSVFFPRTSGAGSSGFDLHETTTRSTCALVDVAPGKALGELQTAVLSVLWESPTPLSVRDVLARVRRRPRLAYTTVLTVLSRLHEQNVVLREKRGKAFFYWPRISREEWIGERAARELTAAGGTPDRAVLTAFLDSAELTDPVLLERLSALIAARRKTSK